MQRQAFFDFEGTTETKSKPVRPKLTPRDRKVSTSEAPRLVGQNLQILELLKQGPVTNTELVKIALKYTSRLSDLRAAGYVIECIREKSSGISIYRLVQK